MIELKLGELKSIELYPWQAEALLGQLNTQLGTVEEDSEKSLEEAYDEGHSDGYDRGYDDGYESGLMEGAKAGREEGYEKGLEEGSQVAEENIIHHGVYRVRDILRYQMGAMSDNFRHLFDREYVCPWCGHELDIEYRQDEQYLAKCPCRVQFVNADSPRKAAEKCVFMLRPVEEYTDPVPVAGYSRPQIEDDLIQVIWPGLEEDPEIEKEYRYAFPLPHATNMPKQEKED